MARVAVIAVHGVADQQPGQTNQAIANLLANIEEPGGAAYEAFAAEGLRIPVRRVPVPDGATHAAQDFDTFAAEERRRMTLRPEREGADASLAFTASLLANYDPAGPDETYDTSVMRGHRRPHRGDAGRHVDIYEFHWADLSRLASNWLRIFAEVYQLLFHLGSLGVHAIRAAVASEPGVAPPEGWQRWAVAQRRAANLLAHDVLLLNLYLVGLLGVLLAAWLRPGVASWAAAGGLGALGIAAAGVLWYQGEASARPVGPAIVTSLVVGAAAFAAGRWLTSVPPAGERLLATLLLFAVTALATWVARKYQRHRPGAARHVLWFGVPLSVFVAYEIWTAAPEAPGAGVPNGVPNAVLHGGEIVYFSLRLLWIGFLIQALLALRAGRALVKRATGAAARRLARVNWTAQLTLSLPAFLFLLLTVFLWAGLWSAVNRPGLSAPHKPLWLTRQILVGLEPSGTVKSLVDGLILNAAGPGLAALMVLVGFATVMLIFAVAPSVLSEVRPPPAPQDGLRGGRWLDSGFGVARWAGRLLVVAVLVILPIAFVVERLAAWLWPVEWQQITLWNTQLLVPIAALLGVGGAGLFVFGDRLKRVTLGSRSILDVLLDVDNYLREHPRDSTPRARMFTRLASLFRHVHTQGYDEVVIVAHSQGSVIVADLLRFIHQHDLGRVDPTLVAGADHRVSFFTMGSPLRQLYGLRFPHLYRWARHEVVGPWNDPRETIDPATGPDPAELGLARWVNAYRSGDYVGRYLWRPDLCDFKYATPAVDASHPWPAGAFPVIASASAPVANRREFCIGAGAHTHYWDGTAPQIGLELDALIRGA